MSPETLWSCRSNLRPHIEGMLDLVGEGVIDPKVIQTEVLDWDLASEVLAYPPLKPVFRRFGEGALPGRAPSSFGPKIFAERVGITPRQAAFPQVSRRRMPLRYGAYVGAGEFGVDGEPERDQLLVGVHQPLQHPLAQLG